MSWTSGTPEESGADAWGPVVEIPPERYTDGLFLGRGGMGVVHSVVDQHLDRVVARKVVREPSEQAEARLLREARITARLDHPGVVPVHDVGRLDDGRLYYTMRLVRGRTLEAALPELPRARAMRHLLDVCAVLAYAHRQGVVHRDLKPSNILVGAFGETQVADWGVAATLDEPRALIGAVGTPATMSPEVARGQAAGPASDVWALGCLLCIVATGEPPFGAGRDAIDRLRTGPLTPPSLEDPELSAILRRALREEPAERYATASSFAADLEAWLDGRPVGAYAYSMSETLRRFAWAWRGPLLAGTAIGCTVLGAAAWVGWRTAQERDRAVAAEEQAVRARDAAQSAEGRALLARALDALSRDDRPRAEIFAARSAELDATPEALGVLAAWHGVPRPRSVASEPLECERAQLLRDQVLCFRAGGVELQGTRVEDVHGVYPLADGSDAVMRTRDRLERWAEGKPGHGVPLFTGPIHTHPGGLLALHTRQGRVTRIDLATGQTERLDACQGSRPEAGHLGTTGAWIACADGTLEHHGARRTTRKLPTGRGLPSAIGSVDDEPIVGTLHGTLFADGHALDVFDGPVVAIEPSPDGSLLLVRRIGGELAVVARDGLLLLTRLPTRGEDASWLGPHRIRVVAPDLREDFELPSLTPVRWPGSEGVATLDVSVGGRLAIGRGDGTLTLHHPHGVQRLHDFEGVLKHVAFQPGGERLLFAGHQPARVGIVEPDGTVQRWETWPANRVFWQGDRVGWVPYAAPIRLGTPGDFHEIATHRLLDLDREPDSLLLLERFGAVLRLQGDRLETVGHEGSATSIASSGSGWVVGDGTTVRDGSSTWELGEPVDDVAISPDGRWLVAGLRSGRVQVQDRRTRQLRVSLNGHPQRVEVLVFDSEGRLYTGSWDGSVRRWDLAVADAPIATLAAGVRGDWARDETSLLTDSWSRPR